MNHTCHTPYCWLLSCAVCASCEACAEAYNARRPTLPDDASAEVRQAVELLRETPVGEDTALDAHWTEARERIAAKVRTAVAAKGGRS